MNARHHPSSAIGDRPLAIVPFRCQPFDLNDKDLIERAHKTGQPAQIARAVEFAIDGFRRRIQAIPADQVDVVMRGWVAIHVIKPRNYFDKYVFTYICQEICDSIGIRVSLVQSKGPRQMKQPASPDVEFIWSYEISPDGKSITCLHCKKTSHNPGDVAHKYCGQCHTFHESP